MVDVALNDSMAIDTPFVPLCEMIGRHARSHPDTLAMRDSSRSLTWAQLADAIDRIAGQLAASGVGHRDVVAILSDSSANAFTTFLGILRAGGCAAPMPVMATDQTIAAMIADSGARVLVTSQALSSRAAAITAGANVAVVGMEQLVAGQGTAGTIASTAEDPIDLIYSSGTTGVPKGILHDHIFRFRQAVRLASLGLDHQARLIVSTPLYSNTTLFAALAALHNGSGLLVVEKFSADTFPQRVSEWGATHTIMVPVQVQRLVDRYPEGSPQLAGLQRTVVVGAQFPPVLKRRALPIWPGKLIEIYGLTEGGVSTMIDLSSAGDKLESIGRPSKGVTVRILGSDNQTLPAGEVGEIVGNSPTVMRGYHNRPEQTRAVFVTLEDGLTYFRTGDLGYMDADGFLYIAGRAKEVIVSGGFNIYASDLEAILLEHPQVEEVAVVGKPSEAWGETPHAFVVARDRNGIDGASVLEFANSRLGKAQRIGGISLIDTLPRNPGGKVLKRELETLARQGDGG